MSFLSPAAQETALDDFDHEGRCFFLTHLWIKSSSDGNKKTYTFIFKAWSQVQQLQVQFKTISELLNTTKNEI